MTDETTRPRQAAPEPAAGPAAPSSPPRPALDRNTILGGAIVVGLIAIGTYLAYAGGLSQEAVIEAARAMENEARANRGYYALVYFAVILGVLLIAVPFGNVFLALAAFLIGVPHALGAHMAAVLLVTCVHYGLVGLGLAGFTKRLAEDVIAKGSSQLGVAVFAAARRDAVPSGVILRLGLGTPTAVTNVVAALVGVPLGAFLIATCLVSWMRPLIVAWTASSLTSVNSTADVLAAIATAGALALPLLVIPGALLVWLAKRNLPPSTPSRAEG